MSEGNGRVHCVFLISFSESSLKKRLEISDFYDEKVRMGDLLFVITPHVFRLTSIHNPQCDLANGEEPDTHEDLECAQ